MGGDQVLGFVHTSNGDIEFCLRHGNRSALRLDRKAVLLIVAGGEIAGDAGQDFGDVADGRGRIEHRPVHPVA
jgi:hypothetical protein